MNFSEKGYIIMSVHSITEENFEQEVLNNDGLVVLDFYANWCQPCKQFSPVIDELATENSGVKFGKVNIEDAPELARQFNIRNIPNVVFIKGGKQLDSSVGMVPKKTLSDIISKHS